jgi:hypothetical protein
LEDLVTSPTPQHAKTNPLVRGWRAFRLWRRTRPFWGGLFTILAGLEIFATTQGSLGGLTFQMGPTGFLSWLIPTILVACGVLMWATPGQRMFYAIVAAMTAVFSLIGVNLGGFLVGLLLGMVGSALGFAWTPIAPPQADPEPEAEKEPEPADETTVDTLLNGPDVPPQGDHWQESDVDATGEIPTQRPGPGRSQLYTVTVVLLSLAVVGVVTLRGGTPAHAAPCKPEPTPTAPAPTPSTTATPTPAPGGDSEEDGGGNIITDIIEGIGDLIGIGGGNEQAPAAEATPTPTPSGTQAPGTPADPTPTPTPTCPPDGGQPGNGDGEEPPVATRVLPPPADIEAVNRIPSIMTGTKLTNYNLEYHGVTDLPLRGGGTMKVLWFNMTKAVTDNFELKPAVPGNRRMSIKAFPLTVEGSVRFFTPRFTGKLLGLNQVYTPATPPPLIPGVPVPVLPITFTDVEIQLAYVDCNTLTAKKLLNTP